MYCSREYQLTSRFIQQYEKSTSSLFEITLDRQLPKWLIPLDVLHNVQNKQPQEMLVPLLNTVNSVVKLPKILF